MTSLEIIEQRWMNPTAHDAMDMANHAIQDISYLLSLLKKS